MIYIISSESSPNKASHFLPSPVLFFFFFFFWFEWLLCIHPLVRLFLRVCLLVFFVFVWTTQFSSMPAASVHVNNHNKFLHTLNYITILLLKFKLTFFINNPSDRRFFTYIKCWNLKVKKANNVNTDKRAFVDTCNKYLIKEYIALFVDWIRFDHM